MPRDGFVNEGRPSLTAQRVARRRAEHQLWDDPVIFADPVALPILGLDAAAVGAAPAGEHPAARALRAFLVARSQFAEEALAAAIERGVRQYVILGAGLDTFAYRNPHAGVALRIFEVDHPATQVWKRQRVAQAGMCEPPLLTFVPVDFIHQDLALELVATGFDRAQPAFFSWLGVSMYLSPDLVLETLRALIALHPGNAVAFDYAVRPAPEDPHRPGFDALAARVAQAGEPFRSFFEPAVLVTALRSIGYRAIEDLDSAQINARYFSARSDGLRVRGSAHLMCAAGGDS